MAAIGADPEHEEKQSLMAGDEKPVGAKKKDDKDGTRLVNWLHVLYVLSNILAGST